MEGIDDKEMNEFVKKNPEYAEDFYKQMADRYTRAHTNETATVSVGMYILDMTKVPGKGVWPKDPLKFP